MTDPARRRDDAGPVNHLPTGESRVEEGAAAVEPQFTYVEEFVRYQLSQSLGGTRGMLESALPFVAFTIAWVVTRDGTGLPLSPLYLSLAVAVATAVVLGLIRVVQRQSVRFVLQAVFPTAIAAIIAGRTGRAEDVFLPGILYNGFLALLSGFTIAIRKPLVGFIIGAAIGDPTGWTSDRGLVKMTTRLTAVLAVPYVTRFVIQLPLFLTGHIVLLGVAKVVLGWPLLLGALFVMGLMLSKGRTPMEDSSFGRRRPAEETG
jgi:hypothetical protein